MEATTTTQEAETAARPLRDFFEGPSARQMLSALTICKAYGRMGAIVGGPGVGKSTTARRLVSQYPGVWMLTANPALGTVNSVLRALSDALGAAARLGTGNYEVWESIRSHLLRTELGLVIVDEAQHLHFKTLEMLRSVHDDTGVGLVLMGDLDLIRSISARAQLDSRCSRLLVTSSERDVDALAAHWSVTEDRVVALLKRVAKTAGGLRVASHIMRDAAQHGGPSLENAVAAMKRLGVGVEK